MDDNYLSITCQRHQAIHIACNFTVCVLYLNKILPAFKKFSTCSLKLISKITKNKTWENKTIKTVPNLRSPGSSAGKESTCNAGDPSLIPGLGSSPSEGIGYPLQYSQTSLVAQLVKNTCNEGNLGSIPWLGRSPGGGRGNPIQFSCLKNPHEQRSLEGYSPWGHKKSDSTEQLSTQHTQFKPNSINKT